MIGSTEDLHALLEFFSAGALREVGIAGLCAGLFAGLCVHIGVFTVVLRLCNTGRER